MNGNSTMKSDRIALELTEDMLDITGSNEDLKTQRSRNGSKSFHLPVFAVSAGVFILIVIFLVLWVKSNKKNSDIELNTLNLKINMMETRLSQLEKEIPELQASMTKGQEPQGFLTKRVNDLSLQVNQLKNQVSSAAAGVRGLGSVQPNPGSQDKGRYHEIKPGETLYRIANIYGFSVDELCRVNDISPDDVSDIQPGRRILVPSKD